MFLWSCSSHSRTLIPVPFPPQHQSRATVHAFVTLFEKGLIYRSNAIVNWSCSLGTAISDIEVDTVEVDGPTLLTVPGYADPVKFGELLEFAYVFQDNGKAANSMITTSLSLDRPPLQRTRRLS